MSKASSDINTKTQFFIKLKVVCPKHGYVKQVRFVTMATVKAMVSAPCYVISSGWGSTPRGCLDLRRSDPEGEGIRPGGGPSPDGVPGPQRGSQTMKTMMTIEVHGYTRLRPKNLEFWLKVGILRFLCWKREQRACHIPPSTSCWCSWHVCRVVSFLSCKDTKTHCSNHCFQKTCWFFVGNHFVRNACCSWEKQRNQSWTLTNHTMLDATFFSSTDPQGSSLDCPTLRSFTIVHTLHLLLLRHICVIFVPVPSRSEWSRCNGWQGKFWNQQAPLPFLEAAKWG